MRVLRRSRQLLDRSKYVLIASFVVQHSSTDTPLKGRMQEIAFGFSLCGGGTTTDSGVAVHRPQHVVVDSRLNCIYVDSEMWPFRKRALAPAQDSAGPPSPNEQLLQSFLELERERIARNAEAERQNHELQMRKYELEMKDIERIGEEKRKQQLFNENLKEKRRLAMQAAREAKRRKEFPPPSKGYDCEECNAIAEGRQPTHASHLMLHLREHHAEKRFGLQSQN